MSVFVNAPDDARRGGVQTSDSANEAGYAKGRARRAAIVRTATERFAHHGFSGATMLDIAAACDISRAGLLHHFPDKESLLSAVLEQRDREDQSRFVPYLTPPSGGIGILRGIVDLAGHNELVPGLVELFARLSSEAADPDHPAHGYFVSRYERIRAGTEQALRTARRAGYLREGVSPHIAAIELTALMDGLQTQWLLDRTLDMESIVGRRVREMLNPSGDEAWKAYRPSTER